MPAAKGKGKAAKGKKTKKASLDLSAAASPLQSLLAAHRTAVPSLLSGWRQRCDLLRLDLHLLHAPYLTLSFLLSTASPLSCLLHRLHAVHGPFSALRLFRCSDEEEDDELTDLSLTLDELGCRGGSASGDEQRTEDGLMDATAGSGGDGGRRRYELWYSLLSSLDGALLMRESRQYISDEQLHEAMLADDEQDEDDEDDRAGKERAAPSIIVTADDSSALSASVQQLPAGGLRATLGRATARAKMGRVVEVAVDQHTSRQRVKQSTDHISEAFEVDAQAGQQQQLQPLSPSAQHLSSSTGKAEASKAEVEEAKQLPSIAVPEAALSLALLYS